MVCVSSLQDDNKTSDGTEKAIDGFRGCDTDVHAVESSNTDERKHVNARVGKTNL